MLLSKEDTLDLIRLGLSKCSDHDQIYRYNEQLLNILEGEIDEPEENKEKHPLSSGLRKERDSSSVYMNFLGGWNGQQIDRRHFNEYCSHFVPLGTVMVDSGISTEYVRSFAQYLHVNHSDLMTRPEYRVQWDSSSPWYYSPAGVEVLQPLLLSWKQEKGF